MLSRGAPVANTDQITIIGPGTIVDGNITAPHMIKMYGKVKGNISSSEAIAIGNGAEVVGNVSGRSVEIAGSVDGAVVAQDKIKLSEAARLNGDLLCQKLIIEEGAKFEGLTSMSSDKLQLVFPTGPQRTVASTQANMKQEQGNNPKAQTPKDNSDKMNWPDKP